MNEVAYLKVEIRVKFRAFGVTFANTDYSKVIAMSPEVAMVETLIAPKGQFAYNDHGVQVVLTLVDGPG